MSNFYDICLLRYAIISKSKFIIRYTSTVRFLYQQSVQQFVKPVGINFGIHQMTTNDHQINSNAVFTVAHSLRLASFAIVGVIRLMKSLNAIH